MSEDPSGDKDYSKRTKRRGGGNAGGPPNDYKQPGKKGPPKDYQVYYESKGYDKSSKEQSGPSKGNYNNSYDDYNSRPPRQDNYKDNYKDNYNPNYKPKPHQRQQRRQGPEYGNNFWRKKATKISKESILESSVRVAPHAEMKEWLVEYGELFVKQIQAPVNDELFQLDPNDGLMAKTIRAPGERSYKEEGESMPETQQSTAPSSNTKGFEMFDFGQERHDPIQAMRDRLRKDQNKDGVKIKKDEDELDGLVEDENEVRKLKNQSKYQELEEELEGPYANQEGDEELGVDGYSNIDEMFEKKLKNNEIPETYEDAFEELLGGAVENRREKLIQMEDDERPEWEELDTKKVIEDIKKEDFLSTLQQLPQDKKTLFGNKYMEPESQRLPTTKGFSNANYLEKPKEDSLFSGGFKDFEFDFSKLSFDTDSDLKAIDDFPLSQEDLFPAFSKNLPQKPVGQEGLNPGFLNAMNLGPSFMQQGNMIRPMPQQLGQMPQMPNMPNMPHMHPPMPQNPQQIYPMPMNPMGQMNPMGPGPGPMGSMPPMNQMPNQFGPGGPGFMGNQLPPYKRDPAREGGMPTPPPRFQPNPSFIFKYFSPNYDDKLWYYIDLQKRVQGPFSGKTMDEWYGNGHLPLTLNVTIGKNNGYKSLKELSDIIINTTLKGDMGTPSNEPQKPAPTQSGQSFGGITDLLKNRPEFAQYAPALETKSSEKAKTLDEVERSNSPQHNQPPKVDYQSGRPDGGYYQNPNPNYHHHGNAGHGGYYQNDYQRNVPKKYSGAGYGGDVDNVKPPSQSGTPNVSTSPGISDGSQTKSVETSFSGISQQQTQPVLPGSNGVNPLQSLVGGMGGNSNVDMTAQLKNMLGLGGLGGISALSGLGGLNIGGGISEPAQKPQTEKQPEKPQERQPEKPVEKPQEKPRQIERQYSGYQEKQQYYQQEKPQQQQQQQQQQQLQRKGSKAPKIDTSDFPSLTESYK